MADEPAAKKSSMLWVAVALLIGYMLFFRKKGATATARTIAAAGAGGAAAKAAGGGQPNAGGSTGAALDASVGGGGTKVSGQPGWETTVTQAGIGLVNLLGGYLSSSGGATPPSATGPAPVPSSLSNFTNVDWTDPTSVAQAAAGGNTVDANNADPLTHEDTATTDPTPDPSATVDVGW